MKKCLVLGLCLLLCACGGTPADSSSGAVVPVVSEESSLAAPQKEAAGDVLQYGRGYLSEPAKALYDDIYQAASRFDDAAVIAVPTEVTQDEVMRVLQYLQDDNPACYWLDTDRMLEQAADDRSMSLPAIYGLGMADVMERQAAIDAKIERLLDGVDVRGDAFAAVVELHDRLADYMFYSTKVAADDVGNIYGGFVDGGGICDSYAKCMQYLLQRAGFPSIYIQGTNKFGIPHAWTGVEIDGGWYFIDLTLNDKDPLRHDYMNMSTEECAREHIWNTKQYPALPESGDAKNDYFIHGGYTVTNGDADRIVAGLAKAFARQLCDRVEQGDNRAAFLEIKVLGDADDFTRVKEIMIRNLFVILEQVDSILLEERPELQVGGQQTLTCNFNEAMQILIYYPVVYPR